MASSFQPPQMTVEEADQGWLSVKHMKKLKEL